MAKRKTDKAQTDADAVIVAYKAFEPDWTCRGFQYEVGKTYTHDGDIELCEAGFHACERAVDVLRYYPPTGHIAAVELGGVSPETDNDSKRVGRSITIKAAITIPMLVAASIEYTLKRCGPAKAAHSDGYRSASSATGDQSASSATGDYSASSATGFRSASSATGFRSASSATGDQSASSATGDQSASSATGYRSASSATGFQSASSATGDQSASSVTGDYSASSATGYRSASSATGDQSASSATGEQAVAAAFGYASKALAGKTGTIIVAWWDAAVSRKRVTVGYVGEDGIEADTWYRCDAAGKLVPA